MVFEEYEEESGKSPFGTWFAALDANAAARVIGGTKKRQQRDIDAAKSFWFDYKARKKGKS